MPCYRVLCLLRPDTAPEKLASIFRDVARAVYREKGQFRGVENLGVRPLHWPLRKLGYKFDDARWVQYWADVSPTGLAQVRASMKQSPELLLATPLRARAELGDELGDFRPHRRLVDRKKFPMPEVPTPLGELLQ